MTFYFCKYITHIIKPQTMYAHFLHLYISFCPLSCMWRFGEFSIWTWCTTAVGEARTEKLIRMSVCLKKKCLSIPDGLWCLQDFSQFAGSGLRLAVWYDFSHPGLNKNIKSAVLCEATLQNIVTAFSVTKTIATLYLVNDKIIADSGEPHLILCAFHKTCFKFLHNSAMILQDRKSVSSLPVPW